VTAIPARTALVVVPTFNERDNLPTLANALMAYPDVSMLIVDDASPDGTGAIADDLARAFPGRIDVMHRTGPRGLGRSYVDGIRWAVTRPVDVICQMDADLSHEPSQLGDLLAAIEGADLVIGARYIAGGAVVNWPLRRRLLSRFANVYIRSITRLSARDCTSGFRCWRRDALAGLPLAHIESDGYSFLVEMLFVAAAAGLRIVEVPITFVERRLGESKLSKAVLVESAITPWRLVATRKTARPSVG
jgi:dolichol-phosphate mannosyltransferase